MFIRELQLDGYGALHGLKLQLEAPVTVIYGSNEAGKSTVLRFIRSMLYGFPTRKEPVERGEPVFGGRHGGRLRLSDTSGHEFVLERYAERGNGLILRNESGIERVMGQAEWERLMLGGISERLFRQLFAVSLNELHELRSLQGEEVGNYLYHAGLAGGSALTAARRKIALEMDQLYRPRGTTQELNRLLAAMKEIETSIRQSRDSIQAYNETRDALLQAQHRLELSERNLPVLRIQAVKLQSAYELREWWLKREALRMEESDMREQLPNPAAPLLAEQACTAWAELRKNRIEATDQLRKTQDAAADLKAMREKLSWDDELATLLPEWERMEAHREGMAARRDEAAELESERRMLDETVNGILSRISGEWGEEELLLFGGMAAEREMVRRLQQTWEEAERASNSLQADIRRIVRQQEVLQVEAGSVNRHSRLQDEASSAFPFGMFVPRTRVALLQAWHNAEDARRSYERVRSSNRQPKTVYTRTSSPRTTKTKSARNLYAASGVLGFTGVAAIVVIIIGRESNLQSWFYILAILPLLLSVGLGAAAFRRHSGKDDEYAVSIRSQRKQVADRLRQLINDPETSAAKLIPEYPDTSMSADTAAPDNEDILWSQLREAVHEQLGRLEEVDRGRSKQQELDSRLQELQLEKELAERDAMKQDERIDELHSQWQIWLQARKLPAHLLPETLPELLGLAEQGQAVLRQRQRVKDRSDMILRTIKEYEQSANQLFERCPPPESVRTDVIQSVQWLYREAMKQQSVKEEAARLERELQKAEALAQEAQVLLTLADRSISSLFHDLQVASEAELEQRIHIDTCCLTLRREAREISIRLESGRDQAAQNELYELLHTHDEATLVSLLSEQKMRLTEEETHRSELLDQRGRFTQELERLRTDAELEDKGMRLGQLQSKLEQLSERYVILALSNYLIDHTKSVFEEEKQPEVLQRSSRYLQQMTNGAYIRIVAPGDNPLLLAETQDRRLLDSAFLSRGTQEQLYLAMRFALCDAAAPEHPLPLLLDDLFVHFDEGRLNHTLPVLEDLARTRQVLLFTCHSHAAQTIAAGIPSAQLLHLPGRGA
ncbi:AAA family ATPase [Cohnella sp.]|uniref:AAA family ATPase n=1 Tax=Cohnella sp. TaxID=1883426 RepID=UPI00356A0E69